MLPIGSFALESNDTIAFIINGLIGTLTNIRKLYSSFITNLQWQRIKLKKHNKIAVAPRTRLIPMTSNFQI